MELPLTPGTTALIINVVTDVLAIITAFSLVHSLNAYGRWALYREGKTSMDMHFHDASPLSAFINVYRHCRASRAIVILFLVQAFVCTAILLLKTAAPVGLSQAKHFRVHRNHTVKGDAHCQAFGETSASSKLSGATERVITHFKSGGSVLSVGRTGSSHEALLVEDPEKSLGRTAIMDTFNTSITITVWSRNNKHDVDIDIYELFEDARVFSEYFLRSYSFRNVHYSDTGTQITRGPLYVTYALRRFETPKYMPERYIFARCDLPEVELSRDQSRQVNATCTVTSLQRDTSRSGQFMSIHPVVAPLKDLEDAFEGLNMSELGQRWVMVLDTANALSRKPCADSYLAYLAYTELSKASIGIIIALGMLAFVCCVTAVVLLALTKKTFNWNGSYQRVINLAANSESIWLASCKDIASTCTADVVVEPARDFLESGQYHVHVVATGAASSPVPNVGMKLIQ